LALKKGITITNSPGTIDEDYHGNVGVIVRNTGIKPFVINKYDKIAQMVVTKIPCTEMVVVDSLEDSVRGNNGFGSTGV
jgi:dUTP pyrophosphatase